MAHVISSFSYYPLLSRDAEPANASDVSPQGSREETDVWLTHWQVAEEGFDIAVGADVVWALVPMDQEWAKHLFGDRRLIPLQLDTYGAATREETHPDWTRLAGRVTRIDQVSTLASDEATPALEPAIGAGSEHEVSNLRARHAPGGAIVGWIVRVRS